MSLNFRIMMALTVLLLSLLIAFMIKSIKEKPPVAGVPVSITVMFTETVTTPILTQV